jgi:hypothetical protein
VAFGSMSSAFYVRAIVPRLVALRLPIRARARASVIVGRALSYARVVRPAPACQPQSRFESGPGALDPDDGCVSFACSRGFGETAARDAWNGDASSCWLCD